MKLNLNWVLTLTLVMCAAVTTVLVVRRELFPPPAPNPASVKPVFVPDWESLLEHGKRFGSSNAPVQLIEFADFECPFCATFHKTLKILRERYPGEVALTFIHFPLPMHRFAAPAARAAECADKQGRFEAMHDSLFNEQHSFGLKAWKDYASEAGIQDLASFEACLKDTIPLGQVQVGEQSASKLDIKETPTLIINGWRLGRPPSLEELDSMVKNIRAGRPPLAGSDS